MKEKNAREKDIEREEENTYFKEKKSKKKKFSSHVAQKIKRPIERRTREQTKRTHTGTRV